MKKTSLNVKDDRLNSLSTQGLQDLLRRMLLQSGFEDIRIDDICVVAKKNGFVGEEWSLYMCFTDLLSGKPEDYIANIYAKIIEAQMKHAASAIFLVSTQNISTGFLQTLKKKGLTQLQSIDRPRLSKLIDKYQADFWDIDDIDIIQYKHDFLQEINDDSDYRKLPIEHEKYKKMLDFFIEPRLSHIEENDIRKNISRKTYNLDQLPSIGYPILLSGGAGTGKSTALKHLGEKMINAHPEQDKLKEIPIYITALELKKNDFKVQDLIQHKLEPILKEGGLGDLKDKYHLSVLMDSIDELDEMQVEIVKELEFLRARYKISYYIATRNADSFRSLVKVDDLYDVQIRKFNYDQITAFIARFFEGDAPKANRLLDSLRDNNIIDKLPITPLSLSLISILYNENDYEVPATITDVYKNFSSLILGRATVSQKVEFVDINFKERILSQYAYELLNRPDHMPMEINDFFTFFKDKYKGKSIPLKVGVLEDALEYLIKNTGLLFVDKQEHVQFTHASYMEYFSSVELFNHYRDDADQQLAKHFFEYNWQNTAIFYAGQTKDMPQFLDRIKDKVVSASRLCDLFSCIGGCGYLLQALFFTDNEKRRDLILENLRLTLDVIGLFKKLATDDKAFYKNFKLPIINILGLMYFYGSYKSITLKEPLGMAFDALYEEYKTKPSVPLAFKLLTVATTLSCKAINDKGKFDMITRDRLVVGDANLSYLALLAMEELSASSSGTLKKDLRNEMRHLPSSHKCLLQQSASSLRFTDLDTIIPEKKVKLLVEGETDAKIIEHAYMILTDGQFPYWNIAPAKNENKSSCADAVAKALVQGYAYVSDDSCVIGIFDHDAAGLGAYRGRLQKGVFDEIHKDFVKKHKTKNIFAMVLPIPEDMQNYAKEDQSLNYFAVEHYFGHEYLVECDMAHEKQDVPGIYELHDGKKSEFAKQICQELDKEIFARFIPLFEAIDEQTGIHVNYE